MLQASTPRLIQRFRDNDSDAALFPFIHTPGVPEPAGILQVRNRARYLAPGGPLDYLRAPALLARGLLLNLLSIAKYLLLLVVVTVILAGHEVLTDNSSLTWTLRALVAFLAIMVVHTIFQSALRGRRRLRGVAASGGSSTTLWTARHWSLKAGAIATLIIVVLAVAELQPIAISLLQDITLFARRDPEGWRNLLRNEYWPLATAVVSALAGTLARLTGGTKASAMNRLLVPLASALVPISLWLAYLTLCRWAIYLDGPFALGGPLFTLDGQGGVTMASESLQAVLAWIAGGVDAVFRSSWLTTWPLDPGLPPGSSAATELALAAIIVLLLYSVLLTPFLNPNVFSLHNFYRDALSRTFLFGLTPRPRSKRDDTPHQDTMRLHQLDIRRSGGPYHLINATINNADLGPVNLRGRHSDLFLFSRHWTGNDHLGYCRSRELERQVSHVNLGTAMAISAAAASPTMGEKSVGPLTRFALAVLNVRLNYWMPTPERVMRAPGLLSPKIFSAPALYFFGELGLLPKKRKRRAKLGQSLILAGLKGAWQQISASDWINVSDGGHIENLGVYELLRRRCRYIVAVDAEADPNMTFNGLARVIKLARIDMGIDIDIDLDALRKDAEGYSERHWALGQIRYGENAYGELLYIKSSLTGDENEYITEYRARHPSFPHESTADQFFDETQFECYRALGFECAKSLFVRVGRESAEVAEDSEVTRGIAALFHSLRRQIDAVAPDDEAYIALQRQRADIERRIAECADFAGYAAELSPVVAASGQTREARPASVADVNPAILQLVNEQLQLMERVVIGLELSDGAQRLQPRNRGWMNLFRRWAETPSFRACWSCSISDYSASFQRFCEEALGLELAVRWTPGESDHYTSFEREYLSELSRRAGVAARAYQAGVSTRTMVAARAANRVTKVPVALALVQLDGERPVALRAFRIRDTFRGMRLSEPLLRELRDEVLRPPEGEAPTFWFGGQQGAETEALERVLLRLGFEKRDDGSRFKSPPEPAS